MNRCKNYCNFGNSTVKTNKTTIIYKVFVSFVMFVVAICFSIPHYKYIPSRNEFKTKVRACTGADQPVYRPEGAFNITISRYVTRFQAGPKQVTWITFLYV